MENICYPIIITFFEAILQVRGLDLFEGLSELEKAILTKKKYDSETDKLLYGLFGVHIMLFKPIIEIDMLNIELRLELIKVHASKILESKYKWDRILELATEVLSYDEFNREALRFATNAAKITKHKQYQHYLQRYNEIKKYASNK